MLLHDALTVALLGGLIGLDEIAIGRFMISMPLVASPLIGMALGAPEIGFSVGILWQLIWIHQFPIGFNIPPSTMVQGILGAGFACMIARRTGAALEPVVVFSLIAAMPAAFLAGWMDFFVRRRNNFLMHLAETFAEKGKTGGITMTVWLGVLSYYLRNILIFFTFLFLLTPVLVSLYIRLPHPVIQGLSLAYLLVPGIGLAVVFDLFTRRRDLIYFLTPILLTLCFLFFLEASISTLLTLSIVCGLLIGMWRYVMSLREARRG